MAQRLIRVTLLQKLDKLDRMKQSLRSINLMSFMLLQTIAEKLLDVEKAFDNTYAASMSKASRDKKIDERS